MKKSILFILVMVLCAMLVFAGCGNSETPVAQDPAAEGTASQEAPEEAFPRGGTSAAVSAEEPSAEEPAASGEAPIIGFSNYASISYFMDMGASAHKAAEEAERSFTSCANEGDPATQPGQIEDLVAKGAQILIHRGDG
jgi:ABC-type sugar transport system substrate-binding protein